MGKTRIVGLDLVKGIAIFMMIIVHTVTQVIADYDGGVFLDIKERLPPIVIYIVIYPLVIIGLWGTVFTFVTGITTTLSCIRILDTNKRAFWVYLFQRFVFLVLLRLGECICDSILAKDYDIFNNKEIRWPNIKLAGNATTLDSIGWTGLIAPISTFLLFPIIKKGNTWMIILCYTIFFYALFAISPWVITAFDWLSKQSYSHSMGLLGDIFGKVCYGRFKIAQTSAFAVAGSMFGCLVHQEETIGFMAGLSSIYFLIGVTVFAIWLIVDPSFLVDIVSENVPLPAHMLSFGCITAFTFIHCHFVDGNRPIEKKYKSRKRCTFQFRLGMLSLTVFCVGGWVARQLALPYMVIFGKPCQHEPPKLLWNVWECLLFMIIVQVGWLLISYIWEKVDFKFSLEYILGYTMAKMVGKEYIPHTRKFVYGPAEELKDGLFLLWVVICRDGEAAHSGRYDSSRTSRLAWFVEKKAASCRRKGKMQKRTMFRGITTLRLTGQLMKNYSRFPRVFFSSQSVDESDDDFKPKSKVKDENPEEVLKFIDKVGERGSSSPF